MIRGAHRTLLTVLLIVLSGSAGGCVLFGLAGAMGQSFEYQKLIECSLRLFDDRVRAGQGDLVFARQTEPRGRGSRLDAGVDRPLR